MYISTLAESHINDKLFDGILTTKRDMSEQKCFDGIIRSALALSVEVILLIVGAVFHSRANPILNAFFAVLYFVVAALLFISIFMTLHYKKKTETTDHFITACLTKGLNPDTVNQHDPALMKRFTTPDAGKAVDIQEVLSRFATDRDTFGLNEKPREKEEEKDDAGSTWDEKVNYWAEDGKEKKVDTPYSQLGFLTPHTITKKNRR